MEYLLPTRRLDRAEFRIGRRTSTIITTALVALALTACADDTTRPLAKPTDPNNIVVCGEGCGGGGGPVGPPTYEITVMAPGAFTEEIDGRTTNSGETVTIVNRGSTITNAGITGYVVQGSTKHIQIPNLSVQCAGQALGTLPAGTCTMFVPIWANHSLFGSGTYVPGPATATVDVSAPSGVIATKSSAITLVNTVTNVFFPTTLGLYGAAEPVSFMLPNTGPTMSNISYQFVVAQGTVQRVVGSGAIPCSPGTPGQLPSGANCVVNTTVTTTNSTGSGNLSGGKALVTLNILQGSTLIHSRTAPILLVDGRFTTASINPTFLVLDGPTAPLSGTMVIAQPVLASARMFVKSRIEQGTVVHDAGSVFMNCNNNGPQAEVPLGFYSCLLTGNLGAVSGGAGTLTNGPAKLVLSALVDTSSNANIIDTLSIPITLGTTPPPPSAPAVAIGTVTATTAAIIGAPGPNTPLSIALGNTGGATTSSAIRMLLLQGSSERYATNGSVPFDCGAGSGIVPAGGCLLNTTFFASNTSPGTGSFAAGAAKLIIFVVDPSNAILSTKTVPVVLAQ